MKVQVNLTTDTDSDTYFDDHADMVTALKANKYKRLVDGLGDELFRPARKHGYTHIKISKLFKSIESDETRELVNDVIGCLEEMYYELKEEYLND